MPASVRELGITLGEKCNFRCRHCPTDFLSPHELSVNEIGLIRDTIKKYGIQAVLLAGGEPTLYVAKANRILAGLPGLERFKVRMTTNGHFANDLDAARKVLNSFVRLTHVQVSYDRYHAEFLPIKNVANTAMACKELGIQFSVSACVSNPLDIAMLNKLKEFGSFKVGIQKVLPLGTAEKNGLGYKHPEFDGSVLSKSCPRKGKPIYLGGCGFSICCSSLVFLDKLNRFSHPTLKEHIASEFHRIVTKKNFGEISDLFKVSRDKFLSAHSDPCTLCAYLFLGRDSHAV